MTSAEPDPSGAEPAPAIDRRPRRRRRWLLRIAMLIALLLCGAVLAGAGWLLMEYPHHRGPGRGQVVEIELPPGSDVGAAAHALAARGALRDPRWFELYARVRGAPGRLRQGGVLLYDNMTVLELLQRVAKGFGSAQLKIVIPEGFSRYEIGARLERWGVCPREVFVRATEDPALLAELELPGPSAEGWLFPDTYLLRDDMDPPTLIRRFVANARRRLEPLLAKHAAALERAQQELGFGLPQLMTLASIVEKEARIPAEQATIAGVFLNRLRDPKFLPKRLQADPTVSYGCAVNPLLPSCARGDGKQITRAMLADIDNAYNTYRRDGLPPGPIANPGVGAIEAVLAPESHDYYYFVASGGGHHRFSHSLEDHHAAVEAARVP